MKQLQHNLIDAQQTEEIIEQLWLDNNSESKPIVYVILDGARNKKIHPMLAASGTRFSCLYDGKLNYELTITAPYIVRLERDADFTRELIQQAWGNSWGIFAIAYKPATLIGVRRNCKKLAFVRDGETKKKMLFRYYDPRVLRVFLPSCIESDDLNQLFGPVSHYITEAETTFHLLKFSIKTQQNKFILKSSRLALINKTTIDNEIETA